MYPNEVRPHCDSCGFFSRVNGDCRLISEPQHKPHCVPETSELQLNIFCHKRLLLLHIWYLTMATCYIGGVVSQWNIFFCLIFSFFFKSLIDMWCDDNYLKVLGGVVSQGKTAPPPETAVVLNLEPATRLSLYFVSSFSLYFNNFI